MHMASFSRSVPEVDITVLGHWEYDLCVLSFYIDRI